MTRSAGQKASENKLAREAELSRGRQPAQKPVAFIDQSRCDRAPGCPVSRICPKKAVVKEAGAESASRGSLLGLFSGTSRPGWKVDEERCTGCLLCARYCPHQAVEARMRAAS